MYVRKSYIIQIIALVTVIEASMRYVFFDEYKFNASTTTTANQLRFINAKYGIKS